MEKNKENNDEISLIDLFAVLMKYKKMIIITVVSFMIFAVVFSIISLLLPPKTSYLPNKYTSSASMIINEEDSAGGGLSSMLSSSGLSSIASLAGLSSTGSTYSSLAIYLTTSNPFVDAIIDEFKILEQPDFEKSKYPRTDAREFVKENLKGSIDEESGVFTLAYTNIDPVFAQCVVNFAVDWLQVRFDELGIDKNKISKENLEKNIELSYQEIQRLQKEANKVANSVTNGGSYWNIPSIAVESTKIELELRAQEEVYKQLKVQYELLKVEMQSETPVFQVLERPEIPEKKSGPSRGVLCIVITFVGIFIAIFLAFLLNAIENIKKDSEAMSKLLPNLKKK
ncbi:MAG: lipopolysaccharide biosynthesis protein [Treponema sp.]|nr:lipopolysaccharide biosynthesis protein [Treponema sp.]